MNGYIIWSKNFIPILSSIVIFVIIFVLFLFPKNYPKPGEERCLIGESPGQYETIKVAAIKNMYDGQDPDGTENAPDKGGPDPSEIAEFVLIRKNVPTQKVSTPPGWVFLGGSTGTDTTHTINVGELPQKPGYDAYYPSKWGEVNLPNGRMLYIRSEGLLIFANNDPATIRQEADNTIYLTDVYQDKRLYDTPDKGYEPQDIFVCSEDSRIDPKDVVLPPQTTSPDQNELQLEWFLFKSNNVWGVHCKPAVYLYPEEKKLINVRVYPKGELSYTDPHYNQETGWTVWANPTGELYQFGENKQSGLKYGYLYYETKILDSEIKKPAEGWSVRTDELETFYNRVLPQLGLNRTEQADFMSYWLNKLPESPYYFVGLINKNQRDYLEVLDVTPQPETSIRFSFYFEPVDEPVQVIEPQISTPVREGFTLVDWGGMIKLHPGTPFTCSQ